jgi:hypothetical protein
MFKVYRDKEQKSPKTGSDITFQKKVDLMKVKEQDRTPYDYNKILSPLSREDQRKILNMAGIGIDRIDTVARSASDVFDSVETSKSGMMIKESKPASENDFSTIPSFNSDEDIPF